MGSYSGGSQCPRHFQVAGIFLGQMKCLFAVCYDFVGLFVSPSSCPSLWSLRFELFVLYCYWMCLYVFCGWISVTVAFKAFDLKGTKCHWDYLPPIVSESVHVKFVELVLVCCNNITVPAPVHGLSPRILLTLKSGLFLFIGCFFSCLFLFTLLCSFL